MNRLHPILPGASQRPTARPAAAAGAGAGQLPVRLVGAARRGLRPLRALPAVIAVGALVAACGSSAPASHSSKPASHTAKPASQAPGGRASKRGTGGASSPTAAVTVATTSVAGYGKVLATAKGHPLFLSTADPSGASKCSGSCARTWTPLTVSGKPKAGAGVNGGLLKSFKRADGRTQVLYHGHALYTHTGASPASFAGTASNGGIWYLVSTSGAAITRTQGGGY